VRCPNRQTSQAPKGLNGYLYWNEEAGIFTTGPEGSRGYKEACWETAGEEAAIWPRFGIADSNQRRRALDNLPNVAMNEFGVDVFPYRKDGPCHFRGAAWVAWTAGIAEAAGREGRLHLLQQLIAQQVRQAVLHKTFFEVIDYKSGRSWRWPGQLWDATAFLSYFYFGVLGMQYDEEGLRLSPAVPRVLSDMEVDDFRYRNALLQIRVKGWGTQGDMVLDGKPVKNVPPISKASTRWRFGWGPRRAPPSENSLFPREWRS